MKCKRCGREISEKACDPWVVYSATRSRETLGLKGTEGLIELQKAIYEFVRSNGKVTREELMKNFSLAEPDLQTQLAILRHCELVKGSKEDGRTYLVPFD